MIADVAGLDFRYTKDSVQAKNLDVMGFEPMTSGFRPASLTTRSIGSLFENGRLLSKSIPTSRKFDGGDASENCDFQRGKQRLQ